MMSILVLGMRGFVVGLMLVIIFTMWTTMPRQRVNFDLDVDGGRPESNGRRDSDMVMVVASNNGGSVGAFPKEDVWRNRASYAERWGHDFVWANMSAFPVPYAKPLEPHWGKIPLLAATFAAHPHATWLWWLDLDAIIMTPSYPITKLFSPQNFLSDTPIHGSNGFWRYNTSSSNDIRDFNMLITQDEMFGINTGSFLIRRGEWADWLLEMWQDQAFVEMGWTFKEQEALAHLMENHERIRAKVGIVKQRVMNAYEDQILHDEATSNGWEDAYADDLHRDIRESQESNPIDEHNEADLHSDDPYPGTWHKGDLLVHLAGCGSVEGFCKKNWQRMWAKREAERDEDILKAADRRTRGGWGIEIGPKIFGQGVE